MLSPSPGTRSGIQRRTGGLSVRYGDDDASPLSNNAGLRRHHRQHTGAAGASKRGEGTVAGGRRGSTVSNIWLVLFW